jgi:tRNA(fMet)-specific endonuclease VapC
MSGSAAIDTNAYIAVQRGDLAAAALLGSFTTLLLPVTILGEMVYGAAASARAARNRREVDQFAANCTLVETTAEIAERYAELRLHGRTIGRPIPDNDLWIAAACLVSGVPLITRDAHFAHLPLLNTLAW